MTASTRRRGALAAMGALALGAAVLVAPGPTPAEGAVPSDLRLNQIQVKGSHNSYHVEQSPETIDLYQTFSAEAFKLAYTHEPLTTQLSSYGVRQIELDVSVDPAGDLYEPLGTPGTKVLHIETIDERSTCPALVDCLAEVKAWSDANPDHVPIAILLEPKDSDDLPGGKVPLPWTAARFHDLDAEIRTVFPEDRIVTPDFLRGVGRTGGADGLGTVYPDPESAVLGHGWPLLDDVRGKVLFLLDGRRSTYVDGDPTLAGRVIFPPSTPGSPDAAFVKRNDPIGSFAAIQADVAAGYLVRTRADLPVETGLTGDDSMLVAALASGAHFVSGDYLHPTAYARYDQAFADRYGQPFDPDRPAYETLLPGGTPARCNPITAPVECTSALVEDLPPPPTTTTTSTSTSTTTSPTTTTTTTVAPATPAAPVAQQPTFTG